MSLRREHVDLKAGTMLIAGGKSRAARRLLHLCGESIEILSRRVQGPRKPSDWVFPSPRKPGAHLTKLNAQHDQVCLDAGVSFVLYDLRHTWATRALCDAKIDIATVAAILGHASLRLVQRYVHPTPEHHVEAMRKYERLLRPRLKVVG